MLSSFRSELSSAQWPELALLVAHWTCIIALSDSPGCHSASWRAVACALPRPLHRLSRSSGSCSCCRMHQLPLLTTTSKRSCPGPSRHSSSSSSTSSALIGLRWLQARRLACSSFLEPHFAVAVVSADLRAASPFAPRAFAPAPELRLPWRRSTGSPPA